MPFPLIGNNTYWNFFPGGPDGEGPACRGAIRGKKQVLKAARSALFVTALAVAALFVYHAHSPALALSPAGRDLIRLHVVANSDSPADQAVKLKVRDRIVAETGALFRGAESEPEAELLLTTHLSEIQQVADRVLQAEGVNYRSHTEVGVYEFPERTYGTLTLPAGRYRALRVVLGAGKGANWWCVLFPPLCFVDASVGPGVAPVTSPALGTAGGTTAPTESRPVAVRFKLAELWQRFTHRHTLASTSPTN